MTLTKPQRRFLGRVAAGGDGYFDGPTGRSLTRRGLIERCDTTTSMGPGVTFTTFRCRLTDAGRAALVPVAARVTHRQDEVLRWFADYCAHEGMPPTVREVGDAMKMTPRGVLDHLRALTRKGLLRHRGDRPRASRAYALTDAGRARVTS